MSAEDQVIFLRSLVDATVDAIIAHRPDGTVIFFNQGACEMLGYSAWEMEHLAPYGWISPDSLLGASVRIEQILHLGSLGFESGMVRKDRTVIPTEVRCKRVDTAIGPVVVAVIRDVTERAEVQRALHRLAYHDALTGVGNRASFDATLAAAIADALRHGDLLGLAYIDLDKFKPINDRFGHATGDEVLAVIGSRLNAAVRAQDMVARLGGDEFAVVLQRLGSADELGEIAERFLACVKAPVVALEHKVSVAASVGLALFDATSDDAHSLVTKAETAMYATKAIPEHAWLVYSGDMKWPGSETD